MRHFLTLLFVFLSASSSLSAQSFVGCNPDILLAVDDTYIIQEADLPMFGKDLLVNDVIGIDAVVFVEGLPPCFSVEQGTGYIFYTGQADGSSCCGTFEFVYTLQSGDLHCTAHVTIIVECGTDKGDCSIITLEPNGGGQDPDNPNQVPDTNCVYVCSGAITTILAPYSDQNNYDWSISGGSLLGTLQDPASVEVQWGASGTGNIAVTIAGPGGTQVLQQCVVIGEKSNRSIHSPVPCLLGNGCTVHQHVYPRSSALLGLWRWQPFQLSQSRSHLPHLRQSHRDFNRHHTPAQCGRRYRLLLSGHLCHGH